MQSKILNPQTWVLTQKVSEALTLVGNQCVLNQSQRYWLLFDAIFIAITMCCIMGNTNLNAIDVMQICYFSLFWNLGSSIFLKKILQLLSILIVHTLMLIIGWRF